MNNLSNRGKRSKALSEVKPIKKHKSESTEFSKDKSCAKGSPFPSHKLQYHAYE